MKIRLTESQLRAVVAESVERLLSEGWMSDRIQDRKTEKAHQEDSMKTLQGILAEHGLTSDQTKPCKVRGDRGFCFTMDQGDAAILAKELKPEGIRLITLEQGRPDSDGVSRNSRFFAYFGSYRAW